MFSIFFLFFAVSALFYYFFSIYSARKIFTLDDKIKADFTPPLSILKPVCGMENRAYDNFASFCKQDYPLYQIIFGVKEHDDPVISVIKKIIIDFPHVDISLVICGENQGSNPKINNLKVMQKKAKYSFLLISDSDIQVGPAYLKEIMKFMRDSSVGAVTCLFRSIASKWLSILEATHSGAELIPNILCAKGFQRNKMDWTLGCSVLIRHAVLEEIGGIQVLENYIGEDNVLGKFITKAGYRIVLSSYTINHVLQDESLSCLIQRQIRRARSTLIYHFWGYMILMFTYGIPFSLAFLIISHFSLVSIWVGACVLIFRLAMAWIVGAYYLKDRCVRNFFWLSPLLDCLSFLLWIQGFFAKKIYWKNNVFTVEKSGQLVRHNKPANDEAPA